MVALFATHTTTFLLLGSRTATLATLLRGHHRLCHRCYCCCWAIITTPTAQQARLDELPHGALPQCLLTRPNKHALDGGFKRFFDGSFQLCPSSSVIVFLPARVDILQCLIIFFLRMFSKCKDTTEELPGRHSKWKRR